MKRNKSNRLSIMDSKKFLLNEDTQFIINEAYKTARTNLVFAMAPYEKKIVVITSCGPAEGKTTNCINLAISMAETGKSVLFIDADMRKPIAHSLFELDNKLGLSSILGGVTNNVSQVTHVNVRDRLDVITSGPIPPNPAELLSSSVMKSFLDIVGENYDYVFVDTPPITVVTDALLLNDKISGIVFVIREKSTSHPAIRDALDRVRLTNGRVLGIVKSACSYTGGKNYKSYKYKYEYTNDKNEKEDD